MQLRRLSFVWFILAWITSMPAGAAETSVRQLEVRIVTGAEELSAGSELELRIYETGNAVRRLRLAHAEPWLPDSTHLIPLTLSEELEPRNVQRFALYYRPASALSPPFEIISADVELPANGGETRKLLSASLSGVIPRQGELATSEHEQSAGQCRSDADCDDQRACNGRERCQPHARGADSRGCVKGEPVVCPVNQVCGEGLGCHGIARAPG